MIAVLKQLLCTIEIGTDIVITKPISKDLRKTERLSFPGRLFVRIVANYEYTVPMKTIYALALYLYDVPMSSPQPAWGLFYFNADKPSKTL